MTCFSYLCCTTELDLSGISVQNEIPVPELNALSIFYEKICCALPVDELLPKLVKERVITVSDKARISANAKTEFERSQYLLDYYIARPLSVGDISFFNKLLVIMSTSSKCDFLVNEIQYHLSTTMKHQKFSGKFIVQYIIYFIINFLHCYFVHSHTTLSLNISLCYGDIMFYKIPI